MKTKISIPDDKYGQISRNSKTISLHSYIYEKLKGQKTNANNVIDHINGNTLDNRIENLREATKSQNSQNRKKKLNCTSDYIGVIKNESNTYTAKIKLSGKTTVIGTFACELEAANAYDIFALQEFGIFAKLNNVDTLCGKMSEMTI